MEVKRIQAPLSNEDVAKLKSGDKVLVSGIIYTARDAAHKRMVELLEQGRELPFNIEGQIIYYVGPAPAKPGRVVGSAGPTTSSRMDPYTRLLLESGLKGMIGKGIRSDDVRQALQNYTAVYMAALGGAAALMSKCITKVEVIAYPNLGTEAIHRFEVRDLPVIVVNDCFGNDLYKQGMLKYSSSPTTID